jgi:hypothetical protein
MNRTRHVRCAYTHCLCKYRKPSEAEARLNNTEEFGPYRKENTTLHRYKDQLVNGCLRK